MLYVRASPMAQQVKNPCAIQETQVRSLGQEDTLEKEMAMLTKLTRELT